MFRTAVYSILLIFILFSGAWSNATEGMSMTLRNGLNNTTLFSAPGYTWRNWELHKDLVKPVAWPSREDKISLSTKDKPINIEGVLYYPIIFTGDSRQERGWISEEFIEAISANQDLQIQCDKKSSLSDLAQLNNELEKKLRSGERFQYNQCTKLNSYYERIFKSHYLNQKEFVLDPDPQCTFEAMSLQSENIKGFRYCENGKNEDLFQAPCMSESYHKVMHNGFAIVSKCLDIDPKELLGLYTTETKMQINAISPTGARGITQLTDVWIKDVNTIHREQYLADMKNNSSAPCRELAERLTGGILKHNSCDVLKFPDSPEQSLFYGMLQYKVSQRTMAPILKKWMKLKDTEEEISIKNKINSLNNEIFKLDGQARRVQNLSTLKLLRGRLKKMQDEVFELQKYVLPKATVKSVNRFEDRKKMLHHLSIYGFNHGISGISTSLETFVGIKENSNTEVQFENFAGVNGKFTKFLKNNMMSELQSYERSATDKERKSKIRDRIEEKLNYIYTLVPNGKGSKSNYFQIKNELNKGGKECVM